MHQLQSLVISTVCLRILKTFGPKFKIKISGTICALEYSNLSENAEAKKFAISSSMKNAFGTNLFNKPRTA